MWPPTFHATRRDLANKGAPPWDASGLPWILVAKNSENLVFPLGSSSCDSRDSRAALRQLPSGKRLQFAIENGHL